MNATTICVVALGYVLAVCGFTFVRSVATRNVQKLYLTELRLNSVANALLGFLQDRPRSTVIGPKNIQGAIAQFNAIHPAEQERLLSPPVDAWERPLRFATGKGIHLVIYSTGLNGIDEAGSGDDIVRRIVIPK